MDKLLSGLKDYVNASASQATAAHEVEKGIFAKLLEIGAQALSYFFSAQGDGNLGETITTNTDKTYKRLSSRARQYQSIFGVFSLKRAVYGTYEGKKIEIRPLDARLQLPLNDHSYLLQDWSQEIAIEVPFKKTMAMLSNIFPITMSVDTLENTNQSMACHAGSFNTERTQNITESLENLNKSESEMINESLLVLSADGKGVPIRHANDEARIESHKKNRGPKPDRKRMAVVGASYLIAPYIRTPEEILNALFRVETDSDDTKSNARPSAIYKSVVANLTRKVNEKSINATCASIGWLKSQRDCFEGHVEELPVLLMDGQLSLWTEAARQMSDGLYVEILDLLHAISYLWDIGNVLHSSDSLQLFPFMKKQVLKTLNGDIKGVISSVRQMATKRGLSGKKLRKLESACKYFEKNKHRMHYDEYLKKGMPIASGVIEGACRHFVKDRMERAGMQWSIDGAQAMLDVRAQKLNGCWTEFVNHRIKKEQAKNHPHFDIIEKVEWPMAA